MQDDLIDAYFVCTKKKRLVEGDAKKVSIQIITLKVEKQTLILLTQGYNNQLHVKKSHFIVSIFLHT